MKTFLLLCALASLSVSAAQPNPVISFPSGGESFIVGQIQYVRLTEANKYKILDVRLSRDGGVSFESLGQINNVVNKKNKNVVAWTVGGTPSAHCVIRVTPSGDSSGVISCTSGEFSISGSGSIGADITGIAAGGDLTGSYPNPSLAANAVTTPKIANNAVTALKIGSGAASSGMVLTSDGSGGAIWTNPASGGGGISIPTTTRYYSVHASAFTMDGGYGQVMTRENGYATISQSAGSLRPQSISAPVNLPHGATITEIQAVITDKGDQVTVSLMGGGVVATVVSNGQFNNPVSTATANHVVDNQNNHYFIKATGNPGNSGVNGVRITYTINQALP